MAPPPELRREIGRGSARWRALLCALFALVPAGCAGAGALGGGGDGVKTVTVAIVSNPQMEDAISLVPEFEKAHPNIRPKFVSLSENEARAKITASVATGGGEFDVVMISNYETPQWARNGWLTDLQPLADATPGYDPNDFLPTVRDALSYDGHLYSVPFYGESSFLMYRKDLFEQAGLTMPAKPTWQQVRDFAARLHDPEQGRSGICLRGKPGWGEVLAPLDTVINTFGGSWYDKDWQAKLGSPESVEAVKFYVDLLREYGQPGGAISGFSECATQFGQGNAAMWYDATSAVGVLEDPKESKVAGKVGYVPAPVVKTPQSGWLYSWSLAIPKTSENTQEAWQFMAWMTSKQYMRLVGEKYGWSRVPPGSRASTYQIPEYRQAAAAFLQPTLDAMNAADQRKPTVNPVPYIGLQFVGIPEFQDLGTRVSQQISAAIAGQQSVDEAMRQSQEYAQTVGDTYREGSR
ncbi:sorbitol/mannitol transport system substrate-binding protein [Pseudonocardia eucalypti]|uniref:ABC transporter substrate-binding protein n=1 Tax=Pseudonocardia eucalypti TaxID=648755 RepID=UPI0017C65E86|nr:sorbitol/mannitol transport system substrate-binding protein [Pseudonocardia eucalypti]